LPNLLMIRRTAPALHDLLDQRGRPFERFCIKVAPRACSPRSSAIRNSRPLASSRIDISQRCWSDLARSCCTTPAVQYPPPVRRIGRQPPENVRHVLSRALLVHDSGETGSHGRLAGEFGILREVSQKTLHPARIREYARMDER
jgi:hypothetical protein